MEGLQDEEKKWRKFLAQNCNDNLEITKTPLYTFIVQRFAVPLLQKLLSILVINSPYPTRSKNRAAMLVQDIALSDRLDTAYAAIDKETTLVTLRKGAIKLLHSNFDRGSARYTAGKELTKKLVRLSLQHNDEWSSLRFYLYMGLDIEEEDHILKSLVDVFCELDDDRFGIDVDNQHDLRRDFAAFLESTAKEDADRFHAMLVHLLGEGQGSADHHRGFQMLRFFHHIFTDQDRRGSLMKAAIMSPFFNCPFSNEMLACAIYLRVCIEEGEEFGFSDAMTERANSIIRHLRRGWIPRAEKESKKLISAIARRPEHSD